MRVVVSASWMNCSRQSGAVFLGGHYRLQVYLHHGREEVALDEVGQQARLVRAGRDCQHNLDRPLPEFQGLSAAYNLVQGADKVREDGVDVVDPREHVDDVGAGVSVLLREGGAEEYAERLIVSSPSSATAASTALPRLLLPSTYGAKVNC